MKHRFIQSFIVFMLLASAFPAFTTEGIASTTVTLEKATHFIATDGSDVLVKPGTYELEVADTWLRLVPGERHDALLLDAQAAGHQEDVSQPTAVSVAGDNDEHILALLLPGGQSLQTVGSYSGTRSRALLSAPQIQARQQLIGSQLRVQQTPRQLRGKQLVPILKPGQGQETLPVFSLARPNASPTKATSILMSLFPGKKPRLGKPQDRGARFIHRAGSKQVEVEKASGGVFLMDTKQLWNPQLKPRLPSKDQAKAAADRFLRQNKLLPTGDPRVKVSFAGFSQTAVGDDVPGKINKTVLDVQANYRTGIVVKGSKGQGVIPVVGGGGEFKVAIGQGGAVIGHNGVWRPIGKVASQERIMPKAEAEARFKKNTGRLRITRTNSYLAYYSAPAFEKQTHLAPVWVVSAQAQIGKEKIHLKNVIIPATKYGPKIPTVKPRPRKGNEKPLPQTLDEDEKIQLRKRSWIDPLERFAEVLGLSASPAWAANPKEHGASWIGPSQGLSGSPANAQGFINGLAAAGWNINFNWGEANAWESDWRSNDDSWVDAADFVFYTGHANENIWILNQPSDTSLHFNEVGSSPNNPSDFYGNRDLEWIIIAACGPHQSSHFMPNVGNAFDRWRGIFDGLHIFLGYGAVTYDNTTEGARVTELMRQGWTVIDAWFRTAWEIQPFMNTSNPPNGPIIFVTAMYAHMGDHATRNDHAWGTGSTVSDPVGSGQRRTLLWSGT